MINNWYKKAEESTDEDFFKDNWVSVDSSFIDAVSYSPLAKVLEIRIKNGKKYTFMDIPEESYKMFLESPSKGKFFSTILKKNPNR